MRWFRRAVAGALVVTAGAVAVAPPAEAARGVCVDVSATGVGQDLGNFQTVADIFVGRVRVGSTAATFTPTGLNGTTLSFTGPIVFTAPYGLGTFTTQVTGIVDITTGAFQASGQVGGGTGLFRRVTGELTFAGVQNLTTGEFTETVTGELCAGRRNALRPFTLP